jgi:hypothetical protein
MNSRVRLVKHGRNDGLRNFRIGKEKTPQQGDQEIVSVVKSWIAEMEQRRRANEHRRDSVFK